MPEPLDSLRRYEDISRAIACWDHAGKIISYRVANQLSPGIAGSGAPSLNVVVDTSHLDPPPQMVAVLKEDLAQQRQVLVDKLAGMGITGLGGPILPPEPVPPPDEPVVASETAAPKRGARK